MPTTTTQETPMPTMTAAYIDAGSVEYAADAAAIDIDEFIDALTEARDEGATHVVGLSGNYRGAGYVRLGLATTDEEG